MSIYDLQATLVGLMDIVTDPEVTPEERTVAEQEIARYVAAEIVKVDGIRAYLRHCDMMEAAAKQERDIQAERAQAWGSRAKRLKQFCLDAMGISGKRKLEGRTGVLSISGNGGLQPLVIDDEKLIPEGYFDQVRRLNTDRVRMALTAHCPACRGTCIVPFAASGAMLTTCLTCGGTGKQGVPGAHLEPRGEHLRVK